jgi:hypothetical protein
MDEAKAERLWLSAVDAIDSLTGRNPCEDDLGEYLRKGIMMFGDQYKHRLELLVRLEETGALEQFILPQGLYVWRRDNPGNLRTRRIEDLVSMKYLK